MVAPKPEENWPPLRAALVVLIISICFATSGPLARVASPAHPLLIAAGRTSLAAVLLLLADPEGTVRAIGALPGRTRLRVMGAGALLAAHFGCFLAGLAATSLPAAVTLVSLEPVAVVLTAWAAFGARPTAREGVGVGLATAGALVVAAGGAGEHHLVGDLLVLLAVALYGLYLGAARALADELPPGAYATLVYASAGLLLSGVVAVIGAPVRGLGAGSLGAIVALAIVPTLGGHTLVQWAARHVPAPVVALVSPGETVGSLAIGAILLHEAPRSFEAIGAILALAGVVVTLGVRRGA
jgi:drug/metabolite transporter (DMT)-like permease